MDNKVIEAGLNLVSDFSHKYSELKQELPYHINIIDELHIDENAHSRILCKLLQCKNPISGEYEILNFLLSYIQAKTKQNDFERIELKDPIITQEKARIDLWIRDKKTSYTVIVENKVNNASDQEQQLARYIQRSIEDGSKPENIFVIYLSRTGDKEPDEQSWENFKDSFQNRYINLSFRDDILPWLKLHVLPNVRQRDEYLLHALKEYIDYLEGIFDKRIIDYKMNITMNEYLKELLGIEHDGDNVKALEILTKKQYELTKLKESIDSVISDVKTKIDSEYLAKWQQANAEVKIKNCAQEIAKELELQPEVHIENIENKPYLYLAFRKPEWKLSIIFEKYHSHYFFSYIGIPGEHDVDQQFIGTGFFIFNCHSHQRNHPFGWEWIEEYNQKPEELLRDIINMDSFKNFIMKYLKGILSKIKENNINLS